MSPRDSAGNVKFWSLSNFSSHFSITRLLWLPPGSPPTPSPMMANSTVALPYYASNLPAALPTQEEIAAAPEISPAYLARRIVQINDYYVVKFGEAVELAEGLNMMFVREHTRVHVPRIYALYSQGGKSYIVMQRIEDQTLLQLWPKLDPAEKEVIATRLRECFVEIRALKPPSYYGSLGEKRLLHGTFWTPESDAKINGPFASESEFIEALALKYLSEGRSRYRADFYRQNLPSVLGGHSPTFTHGDFQRKNIILSRSAEHEKASETSSQWQVTIVDWETSGWYPSYWEYSLAACALRYDDDWCLWVGQILARYSSQSAWMHDIFTELWS